MSLLEVGNSIANGGSIVTCAFDNTSDDHNDYIYPKFKVYINQALSNKGTVTIKNATDSNNEMTINLIDSPYIVIDCNKKTITNSNGVLVSLSDAGLDVTSLFDYNEISTDIYNLYWPRLKYGLNNLIFKLSISGSVTKIEVINRFVRKGDMI